MGGKLMAWAFYLNVTNDTDWDLEVVESQLHLGYWNTSGEEDKELQVIKAGETIQAVGVKSVFGPNGYECSCFWRDKVSSAEKSYGTVTLKLNVPHKSKNEAECMATNLFHIDNRENLPEDGHNFVRSIIVTKK